MEKFKFVQEYEIKASARQIYPLLSTPTGLAEWFCDDVRITPEKQFSFLWDGQRHLADIIVQRLNKMIKFQFKKDDAILHPDADPSFIELHIDANDITQTTFLKVIDYSENANAEDLEELWADLIQKLREALGVG
jgi:uncharacterized protein YndB with AHSA1/START domain